MPHLVPERMLARASRAFQFFSASIGQEFIREQTIDRLGGPPSRRSDSPSSISDKPASRTCELLQITTPNRKSWIRMNDGQPVGSHRFPRQCGEQLVQQRPLLLPR